MDMDIEYVEKYDKEGNHFNFIRYQGHIFAKGFPRDVQTRLGQIQEMEIRDDDIIIVEFMKSGTYQHNVLYALFYYIFKLTNADRSISISKGRQIYYLATVSSGTHSSLPVVIHVK